MPFYRFHFYDGQSPVQMWAPTRQDAESAVRSLRGANFTYAGEGNEPISGYQTVASGGTGGQQPGGTVPGGGGGAGTGGGAPPDVQADLDDALKMSAFSSGMEARGLNTEGALGGLLRRQAVPAYANFSLDRSFAGNDSPPDANSFRAYTANKGPNAYSDSLDLYRKASSAPYGSPDFYDALNRAGVGDTDEQKAYRGNFMDVAQGAARARYSPAAARFLPDEETLNRRFNQLLYTQGGKGANAQGVSLLDFLKRQYGF